MELQSRVGNHRDHRCLENLERSLSSCTNSKEQHRRNKVLRVCTLWILVDFLKLLMKQHRGKILSNIANRFLHLHGTFGYKSQVSAPEETFWREVVMPFLNMEASTLHFLHTAVPDPPQSTQFWINWAFFARFPLGFCGIQSRSFAA